MTVDHQPPDEGIELRRVSKSLSGRPVLIDVSIQVPARRITAVVGPSGAGKSVTVLHAAGRWTPDTGEVRIDGASTNGWTERRWMLARRHYPLVPQGAALLDGRSLFDNVRLAARTTVHRSETDDWTRACLRRVGLSDRFFDDASTLPPGVRMRGAVARALALRPRLVLFDEPTSGLEPAAARSFDALLLQLRAEGVGSMVVTHDLATIARIPDQVFVVVGGRVHAQGTPAVLQASTDPALRQFFDAQAEGPLSAGLD